MTAAEDTGQQHPPEDATAPQEDSAASRSAVDALIADALKEMGEPSLSIRELERRNGMPEGSLSTPLKRANRGKWATLQTLERFSLALNKDITTVSRAFAADSPVGDPNRLSPRQRQAVELLAKMPEAFQDAALQQLAALVELARGTANTVSDTQVRPD